MYLNLVYEHKVNNAILPNCQPIEVYEASRDWIIDNNSSDVGHLMKYIFDKFGNQISVYGNGLGFETLSLNNYNNKYSVGVIPHLIDDVVNNYDRYKGEKFFFVIEPFGHINFFADNFTGIHPDTLEKLNKLNATIIINYAHEGHMNEFFIKQILKKLRYKKVIFMYNDYLNDFSNIASKNIVFLPFNFYLNRSSRYFQHNFKGNIISDVLDYSEKEYHFLSFNQWLHHHRTKLISDIYKSNNQNKFLMSFTPKFFEYIGGFLYDYENQLRDMGFWEEYQHVKSLEERKVDYDTTLSISGYGYEDITPYKKSVISLISDTIFFKKQGFISEKIFKPIMYFQPFLIAGPPHYLKAIREMGFETFDGFIDESYDTEWDDMKRLEMITAEIKRICNIPIEELKIQLKEIEPKLIHNQIKLLTHDYEKYETIFCKKLINEGLDNEEYSRNLL
jgi:hypothetical protein